MTWHEMQGQFRHPMFVGMVLLLALCIVLIGPYDHLLNSAALRLTLFYAACFGSFSGLLYLALYLCHRFGWPAHSVLTVGFAGVGSTLCGLAVALALGAPVPSVRDMGLVLGFNLVFCYLGDFVLSIFIIPRVLADLRGRHAQDVMAELLSSEARAPGQYAMAHPAEAAPPDRGSGQPAQVRIFGHWFDPARIFLIEAQEHYISVTVTGGSPVLLRGRILDAVALLPPDLGRQVHRSYWVSANAVAQLRSEKSGVTLVLSNGQTVPVARSRLAKIRPWAEAALVVPKQKAPQGVPSVVS